MVANRRKLGRRITGVHHNSKVQPQWSDPAAARAYLETIRWPGGPVCPHCGGGKKVYRVIPSTQGKTRQGVWKCASCGKQFTVTVNTLFEDSKLPLNIWLKAIGLMCRSRRGITACELHQELKISYKSAWKLIDRIRYALNRPRHSGQAAGQPRPERLYPWPLAKAVKRFLQTVPERKHPDALKRAAEQLGV